MRTSLGRQQDFWSGNFGFLTGVFISLLAHLIVLTIALLVLEHSSHRAWAKSEVFTVTLEGGPRLGGISQAPEEGAGKRKKVLPIHTPAEDVDKGKPEQRETIEDKIRDQSTPPPFQPVPERKLTSPSVVEDPEKVLALRRAEEQKRALQEKQKREEEKKKRDEERKKKQQQEEEKQKEQERLKKLEEKQKEEQEKKKHEKRRDLSIQAAIKAAQNRYKGESADAGGGEEFGAAKHGGKGMGGGTPVGAEFLAYRNELNRHIKSGWHWLPGGPRLTARILIVILPSGEIQKFDILQSSGNESFDESALRAIEKASPVPAPPQALYEAFFHQVTLTFDSFDTERQ